MHEMFHSLYGELLFSSFNTQKVLFQRIFVIPKSCHITSSHE